MPLEGIRVLEWAQYQQAPGAAVMLADLGAEVIKIEEPGAGDPARTIHVLSTFFEFEDGRNSYFEVVNRNKKAITVDMRSEEGRQIVYQLVEKADVFLHGFLDSSVRKLGLDYESLSSLNPRLVYVQVSGQGHRGPDGNAKSFDYMAQARSGLMSMVGGPELEPQYIQGGIGDQSGSVIAAYAAIVALLARERLGVGQKVDASMLGALVWLQQVNVGMQLFHGKTLPKYDRPLQASAIYNHYRCGDGKWLVLACNKADRYWPAVIQAMGLGGDPRFADPETRRGIASPELIAKLDEVFSTKPRAEWMAILKEHDVVCGELNDFEDVVGDPQILANEYIAEYDHPAWGPVKMPGIPFFLSKTPGRLRAPAPGLGEHTDEVLAGLLGYDSARLAELRGKRVI